MKLELGLELELELELKLEIAQHFWLNNIQQRMYL